MSEKWWHAAQERLQNELCLFPWQGYPRWPGIVCPPLDRSKILAGEGHFFPPNKDTLNTTFLAARRGTLQVRKRGMYEVNHQGIWRAATLTHLNPDGTVDACLSDSDISDLEVEDLPRSKIREAKQTGVRKRQKRAAGCQKVGKSKVKAVKPDSAFVLVYSLGDEMYKWVRSGSLLRPFARRVEELYTFRGCKASALSHLRDMDPTDFNGFDGRTALKEALEELRRRQTAARQEEERIERERQYRNVHGQPAARRATVGDIVRVISTGRVGKIAHDDRDNQPYKITYDSGEESGWLREADVVFASASTSSTPPQKRRSLEGDEGLPFSAAKHHRPAGSLPGYLRGELTSWGEALEEGEASERFSVDEVRRALALLGLGSLPSQAEELRRAFRKRALECHPDKQPANRRVWATQEMQRISSAYRLLLARIEGRGAEAAPRTRLMLGL